MSGGWGVGLGFEQGLGFGEVVVGLIGFQGGFRAKGWYSSGLAIVRRLARRFHSGQAGCCI